MFSEGKKIPFHPKKVTEGDAGKAALHNMSIWPIMELLSRNVIPKHPYFIEGEISIL